MASFKHDSCYIQLYSDDQFYHENNAVQRWLDNSIWEEQLGREALSSNFSKSLHPNDKEQFDINCEVFLNSLQLSSWQINLLQIQTKGQGRLSGNSLWRDESRIRLPDTVFGRVFRMQDAELRWPLVAALLKTTPRTNGREKSVEYGRNLEPITIDQYQNSVKGRRVKTCGLFVHEKYGYLTASPTGLIGNHGILVVKCPFLARRYRPSHIPRKVPSFYCTLKQNGQLRLKTDHIYYYQIQGQLEITDRKFCDFVVWTQRGLSVERIWRRNKVWKKMFPKLERFYKLSLLPELVDRRCSRGLHIREPDFVLEANETRQN